MLEEKRPARAGALLEKSLVTVLRYPERVMVVNLVDKIDEALKEGKLRDQIDSEVACERCGKNRECEEVPLHGYSERVCKRGFNAMRHAGETL